MSIAFSVLSTKSCSRVARTSGSRVSHCQTVSTLQPSNFNCSCLVLSRFLILVKLRFPVFEAGFRQAPFRAVVAVPEATVHEDRLAPGDEGDIRPAGQVSAMQAVSVAHGVQQPAHDQFRSCVPAPDRLHDAAALLRGAGIHNRQLPTR